MMMYAAPWLDTLELLDISSHVWVGSALVDLLRTRSKTLRLLRPTVEFQHDGTSGPTSKSHYRLVKIRGGPQSYVTKP
jgi:hypothetical protein